MGVTSANIFRLTLKQNFSIYYLAQCFVIFTDRFVIPLILSKLIIGSLSKKKVNKM